jgi:hypothetical protein
MSKKSLLWFVTATLFLGSGANATTTIELQCDSHTDVNADAKNVQPDRHVAQTLILAERSFVMKSSDAISIYDFTTRKRIVIDLRTKTRIEYSLYDMAGLRLLELRNRINIRRAMTAAKLEGKVASLVDSENSLSIQETATQPLQVAADATDETFASDARIMARISLAASPVSIADARMFAQYLRYTNGGHPQILAAVAASNGIPSRLVFTNYEVGTTTQTLSVQSVRATNEPPIDIASFALRPVSADKDPVDAILDRAAALTAKDTDTARQRNQAEFASAFRDSRILDALLTAVEWNLMTGEGLPPMTAEQKALFQSDERAMKYVSALQAKGKENLTEAVKILTALRPATSSRAYMIDLAIANDFKQLGDRAKARQLFIDVLTANPCLGSAYKDFGDSLIVDWDIPRAWRSWDAGRRIAPHVPIFTAVDQFERSLVTGHPEYF